MRRLVAAALVVVMALPLWAGTLLAGARHTVLMDVLQIRELSGILHEEGLKFGTQLNEEWLGGQGGQGWSQQVAAIYAPDRISEGIRAGLEPALEGEVLEEAIVFFASDLGQKVIMLENAARRAMADESVDAQARAKYLEIKGSGDPRLAQIDRMIDAGDLINRNVTSALNSNYQFLRALVDGDVYLMDDEEILEDVLGERDAITEDTTIWLGAFFSLAYSPLSLEELTTYADFSETAAGKALNNGFFAGFDPLYEDISYALGRAMALNMAAEEL